MRRQMLYWTDGAIDVVTNYGIVSFPFVKDGPVYPMVLEMRKEALKHLCLALRQLEAATLIPELS